MPSKTEANWAKCLDASTAKVESWLSALPDEQWHNPIASNWTVKDLIGHLAAWSNLLLDQIEALAQGNPEKIAQVDIDSWNAAQIARRSSWSTAKIRAEWQQSNQRAQELLAQIPAVTCSQPWQVAWAEEPITINDLLDLLLLHLEQHQGSWQPKNVI